MIMTSLPLSVLTSSIHFVVCWNELTSGREGEQRDQYYCKWHPHKMNKRKKKKERKSPGSWKGAGTLGLTFNVPVT